MNKLIITGDIHLNLSKNYEFELNRFKEYIEILNQEEGVIIFAGDLFDKPKPTLQEIKVFYWAIDLLSKNHSVIVIDGNHEKVDANTTTFDYLPKNKFQYYSKPTLIQVDKVDLWLVGHSNLDKIKEIELRDNQSILISHFRCSLGVVKQEVDVNYISKTFDYCVAGDIHQHYKPYENVEYTSQPYNTHYDIQKDNGYIVVEIKKNKYKVKYKKVNLTNKYKLELSAKEYKEIYSSLSDENLYKITIKDIADNVKNLPQKPNILLTYRPDVLIDEDELDNIKEEIKTSGNIDVVSTLKRLVRNSEELSEDTLRKGEEIIEYIMKGYL